MSATNGFGFGFGTLFLVTPLTRKISHESIKTNCTFYIKPSRNSLSVGSAREKCYRSQFYISFECYKNL